MTALPSVIFPLTVGFEIISPSRKMASGLPMLRSVSSAKIFVPSLLKEIATCGARVCGSKTCVAPVTKRPVSAVCLSVVDAPSPSTSRKSRSGVSPMSWMAFSMSRSPASSATMLLLSPLLATYTSGSDTPNALTRRSMTSRRPERTDVWSV